MKDPLLPVRSNSAMIAAHSASLLCTAVTDPAAPALLDTFLTSNHLRDQRTIPDARAPDQPNTGTPHFNRLQAFEDVNKRTSQVATNVPLLKAGLAPMSLLAIDDDA